MKIRRVIQKEIQHDKDGIQASGRLNAVIAVNVDEQHAVTAAEQKRETSSKRKPRKR
jgi:hypothetical protein